MTFSWYNMFMEYPTENGNEMNEVQKKRFDKIYKRFKEGVVFARKEGFEDDVIAYNLAALSVWDNMSDFEEIADCFIKYLNKNHHPHTSVIIDNMGAEILEGTKKYKTDSYLVD